jgi:hypothetical protein
LSQRCFQLGSREVSRGQGAASPLKSLRGLDEVGDRRSSCAGRIKQRAHFRLPNWNTLQTKKAARKRFQLELDN